MKKILLIITALLIITSVVFSQSKININDLVEVEGKKLKPNSDQLYSGIVFDTYEKTGNEKLEGFYRKGLKNARWTWLDVEGNIDSTGKYMNGLKHGQWEFYHDNGQIKAKGDYRNGDGTNRDKNGISTDGRHGKWTFWYNNGLKALEITYKDGDIDGVWTSWNKKGQKEWEGTSEEYKTAKEKAAAEKAAAGARAKELAAELAAAETRAKELAAELAAAELAAAELAADKLAAAELAAAELAAAELAADKLAAAEKARVEAEYAELAAELAADCQKVYDLSQQLYKAGKPKETMEKLETTLRMEGCEEGLNSKAFYLIAWNYANDQGKLEKARALYQRVVDSFSPGLKYVDKAKRRLKGYKINDLAEDAYDNDGFGASLALREQLVKEIGFDKELKAKNQYLIGFIYQYKLEEVDKAKEAYQKVGKIHPKSDYVTKAEQKLATL